ncbi:hypothetical protein ACFW9B_20180, partial [Streptomyces yangpuensis]
GISAWGTVVRPRPRPRPGGRRARRTDADGRPRLEVAFQDARHAEWALWQPAPSAEALAPRRLRSSLPVRSAAATAARHGAPSPEQGSPS